MSEGLSLDEARQLAAQCWCRPETEHLTMCPDLCEEFAQLLQKASKGVRVVTLRPAEGTESHALVGQWHLPKKRIIWAFVRRAGVVCAKVSTP